MSEVCNKGKPNSAHKLNVHCRAHTCPRSSRYRRVSRSSRVWLVVVGCIGSWRTVIRPDGSSTRAMQVKAFLDFCSWLTPL